MLRDLAESYISVLKIVEGTSVDGEGLRTSIYAAGCSHKCPGCHNPQSWSIDNGIWMSVDEIFNHIQESGLNVTFTGGDPFFQADAFAELAYRIKTETDKTIWCYTGYTADRLCRMGFPLLRYVDVLVDGPLIQSKKDSTLRFRGSSNQRVLERIGNTFKEKKL